VITKYGAATAFSIGIPLLLAAGIAGYFWWPAGIVFGVLTVFVFSFFRDPARSIPPGDNVVVAPADGKIADISRLDECPYFDGPAHRVGIFMSIFNVHVNRLPLAGTLVSQTKTPGKFLNALNPLSASENENTVTLWKREDGAMFAVKQIAGIIARTVVTEAEGEEFFEKGQSFGMIKFGSRTEVYLPGHYGFDVKVKIGQAIHAGSTILGEVSE